MRDAVTVREEIGRLSEKLAQVKEAHEAVVGQISAIRDARLQKGEGLKSKKAEYDALLAEAKALRQQFATESEALDARRLESPSFPSPASSLLWAAPPRRFRESGGPLTGGPGAPGRRAEHEKLLALKEDLQKTFEQVSKAPAGSSISLPPGSPLIELVASLGADLSGMSPAEVHKQASAEIARRLQVRRGELEAAARKVTGLRLLILAKNDELQARRTEYEGMVAELQDARFRETAQEKYQELAAAKQAPAQPAQPPGSRSAAAAQVYDMLAGHVVTLRSVLKEIRKAVEKQKEGLEECAIERAQLKGAVQKKQAELGFPVEKLNALKDALRARTRDLEERREGLQRASAELAETRDRIETLAERVRGKRGLRAERESFVSNLVSLLAALHSAPGAGAGAGAEGGGAAALEGQVREIKEWLARTSQLEAALQAAGPGGAGGAGHHREHAQRLEAALRRARGRPTSPTAPPPPPPTPSRLREVPDFDAMDEKQLERFIEATASGTRPPAARAAPSAKRRRAARPARSCDRRTSNSDCGERAQLKGAVQISPCISTSPLRLELAARRGRRRRPIYNNGRVRPRPTP
eukprot:tig00021517_g21980.t1